VRFVRTPVRLGPLEFACTNVVWFDLAAAEAFFHSAWTVTGVTPDRITTDRHDAYPRAIRNIFGERVAHRTNRYLNNHLEQDHLGIKQRDLRVDLKPSTPLPASAASSMKFTPFSVRGRGATDPSH
jgi:transposase-like protein